MGRLVRSSDLPTNIPVAIQGSHSIAFRGVSKTCLQFYLKTQGGWAGENYIELSKAEVPIDTHWTVEVMGASICPSCGDEHAR